MEQFIDQSIKNEDYATQEIIPAFKSLIEAGVKAGQEKPDYLSQNKELSNYWNQCELKMKNKIAQHSEEQVTASQGVQK